MEKFKFLQKKKVIVLIGVVVAAAAWYFSSISGAVDETRVALNGLTGSETKIVDMQGVVPVTVNDRTLVPLRAIFEQAGFKVDWSEEENTAYVTLDASADSEKPIETYCDRLLTSVNKLGSAVKNKSVCVAITVGAPELKTNYEYVDEDGEEISLGATKPLDVCATMITDGYVMLPLRSMMESFGLDVSWNQSDATATVSIPETITETESLSVSKNFDTPKTENLDPTPVTDLTDTEEIQTSAPTYSLPDGEIGEYIGKFRITHYCTCSICNGHYGNTTAFGGAIRPGVTIAVDPSVIRRLSNVYIDGYGVRCAEDTGSAIKGYAIDVAVSDHALAMAMGVVYKDVWYVK